MKVDRTPAQCPFCRSYLDAHVSAFHDRAPVPGAAAMCRYCQRLSIFADLFGHLVLRPPTQEELLAYERLQIVADVRRKIDKDESIGAVQLARWARKKNRK